MTAKRSPVHKKNTVNSLLHSNNIPKLSPYLRSVVSYRNHGVCHHHHHILLLLDLWWIFLLVSSAAVELLRLSSFCRLHDSRLQAAALWQLPHLCIQPEQLLRQLPLSHQQEHQTCWAEEQQDTHPRQQHLPSRENSTLLLHVCALFPPPAPPLSRTDPGLWNSQAHTAHNWAPANRWDVRGELRRELLERNKHVKICLLATRDTLRNDKQLGNS